jgi:hypothetical protein
MGERRVNNGREIKDWIKQRALAALDNIVGNALFAFITMLLWGVWAAGRWLGWPALIIGILGPISAGLAIVVGIGAYALVGRYRRGTLSKGEARRLLYGALTGLATASVVLVAGLAYVAATQRPSTIYFVVDATEQISPVFNEVRTHIQAAAPTTLSSARVGLRIYGSQLSGVEGCRDTTQLIEPAIYKDLANRLDSALSTVHPSGYGSLTVAVLETVYTDLAEIEGPVRLIVITSGPDPRCDPLESGILESRAKDIPPSVDILIISIGQLTLRDSEMLNSCAGALGGRYYGTTTPAGLPDVITEVSYYGSSRLEDEPAASP